MNTITGDISLSCGHCSSLFTFSVKEQELYKSRNFQNPKICMDCRALRKRDRLKKEEANDMNKMSTDDSCGDFSSAVIDLIKKKRRIQHGIDDDKVARNSKISRVENSYGMEKEVDPHKIETRLKQIQYGYNTVAYDNYVAQVPKTQRNQNYDEHPRTPDPYIKQSKRAFDGRVRKWRRELHRWDIKEGCEGEIGAESGSASINAPEKLSRSRILKEQQQQKISEEQISHDKVEIEVEEFGNDHAFFSKHTGSDQDDDCDEDEDIL